jgi:hypothetical protein
MNLDMSQEILLIFNRYCQLELSGKSFQRSQVVKRIKKRTKFSERLNSGKDIRELLQSDDAYKEN